MLINSLATWQVVGVVLGATASGSYNRYDHDPLSTLQSDVSRGCQAKTLYAIYLT